MNQLNEPNEPVQTLPDSPRPGQVWKHYKKPIPYVVQAVREIEELGVWVVVYQGVFFNERPWVLTLDRWHSMVETEGQRVARYTLLFETFKGYMESSYEVKQGLHYETVKRESGRVG